MIRNALELKNFLLSGKIAAAVYIDRKDMLQYPVLGQKIGVARTFKQFVPRLAE